MRTLFQSLLWPVVFGILLAIILLQQFPALTGSSVALAPISSRPQQANGPYSYASAVAQAAPAVVNVYTRGPGSTNPLLEDPSIQNFYGTQDAPGHQRLQSSLGSGVIISTEGYILTNNHVIENAPEVLVALQDGREALARVIGTDPESDLAVLSVELDNLPAIALADSQAVEIGDVVLAIGNPFGLGQTVTQGIVSATGRHNLNLSTYEDFIQTDAAINLGNSGGALVDARGHLIGINTAIVSRSGGSQGIAFAIPTELAIKVLQSIIEHGEVIRGWLGVEGQPLTPELAESFGLSAQDGMLIAGVYPDSPASTAGLERGDLITSIAGQETGDGRLVMNQVALLQPGDQIQINVLRQGRPITLALTVGKRPRLER